MAEVDLDSDVGGGSSPWTTGNGVDATIVPLINSASIAIGSHTGDPNSMRRTVEMVAEHGVAVGVRPGSRDLIGFGRRYIATPTIELVNDMPYQLDTLREFTRLQGLLLQHVEPHNALYTHLAHDEATVRLFVETLQRLEPELLLYCIPGSTTQRIGWELGQLLTREFYTDRDYDHSGSVVSTRRVVALDPQQVVDKVLCACHEDKMRIVEGEDLDIVSDSVCIYSDTPGALELVADTRTRLGGAGIHIKAPR